METYGLGSGGEGLWMEVGADVRGSSFWWSGITQIFIVLDISSFSLLQASLILCQSLRSQCMSSRSPAYPWAPLSECTARAKLQHCNTSLSPCPPTESGTSVDWKPLGKVTIVWTWMLGKLSSQLVWRDWRSYTFSDYLCLFGNPVWYSSQAMMTLLNFLSRLDPR